MKPPQLAPLGPAAIAADLGIWLLVLIAASAAKAVVLRRIGIDLRRVDFGDYRIWAAELLTPAVVIPSLTLALNARGQGWADLLLAPPTFSGGTFLAAVVGLTAITLTIAAVIRLLPALWNGSWPPSRYLAARGRPVATGLLLLNLVLFAGLTEELAFRGFLMSRLALAFGGTPPAWVAAVAVTAFVFGFLHFQHGVGTTIAGAVLGIIYGAAYLITGNLWVVVVAHSLHDTARLVSILGQRGGLTAARAQEGLGLAAGSEKAPPGGILYPTAASVESNRTDEAPRRP